jgi:hypothetical protein
VRGGFVSREWKSEVCIWDCGMRGFDDDNDCLFVSICVSEEEAGIKSEMYRERISDDRPERHYGFYFGI